MKISKNYYLCILLFLFFPAFAQANTLLDSDKDGVPDQDEIGIYKTNPYNFDTDGDGYSDWVELTTGFSPLNPESRKLEENDYDQDGLSDRMELNFHTDLSVADTDGDGFLDGEEIAGGYNPLSATSTKLEKRIEVNLAEQKLGYFLGEVRMAVYPVSSGAHDTTHRGEYTIANKHPKAWSSYGLWMPWWMSISGARMGFHELPIWPSGFREGEDHLGKPVSHGCVRLGIGPAEELYNWAEIGTKVYIY